MIKLINKDNAIVGMVVHVHDRNGNILLRYLKIESIENTYCQGWLWKERYFELVSMPERRRLTWEYVKEHIDELPNLKFYRDSNLHCITSGGPSGIRDENADFWTYADYLNNYIDPPHPEIQEVPEPWLVNDSPKKPRKTIEIECCFHCKWSCYSESNDAPTYCNLSDKLIPDLNVIPDFCLLEDAK